MSELIEAAQAAEKILLPKSNACKPAVRAFEEATGIEVPQFKDRTYLAKSRGRKFFSVSAKDIPRLVNEDNAAVGVTGLDQYLEEKYDFDWKCMRSIYTYSSEFPAYKEIGPPMCYLALLATKEYLPWVLNQMGDTRRGCDKLIRVVTSFPRVAQMAGAARDTNIFPDKRPYNGSIEIMPELLGCRAVVDIVREGKTATANGLVVVQKLMDVPPVIIGKVQTSETSK